VIVRLHQVTADTVHRSARRGFSSASTTYVSGRPGYPDAVEEWLKTELKIGSGQAVIDLGAGTGRFTERLIKTGAKVIAIEPIVEMLSILRQTCPGVDARQGTASEIPIDKNCVDAVFCAQSFHWFASKEALAEIRRVLKPGGVLGLIWNIRDETCDWVAALHRIIEPYQTGTPQFDSGEWRRVFPASGFSDLNETSFDHVHSGEFQAVVVNRIMSVSFIASLPKAEREKINKEIQKVRKRFREFAGKADIRFPYRTLVAWSRKTDRQLNAIETLP
jgi:ubiquinone/menaquinone biosynthesis C-methylase UbiE